MFSLVDVSKAYGQEYAVKNISLDIPKEAIITMIGPSGSGKSTILKLLLGFVEPSSGLVLFKGKPLHAYEPLSFKKKIGLVVQSGGLFPHLSAEENIGILGVTEKWSIGKQKERILELAEQCQMPAKKLSHYPYELSGGQRQRVSLMRALFLDPEVLILDEPFSALDPLIRRELQQDLKQLFKQMRKTVILVTHDLSEAAYFSQKIALLEKGNLVQFDTYKNLTEKPSAPFVTQFLNAQRPLEILG